MIFVLVLLLLALIGVPLFALLGAATLGLCLDMPEGDWSAVAVDAFGPLFARCPSLMTIPLLAFAGHLLAEAASARRLSALGDAWLGWLPGGLAIARGALFPAGATLVLYGMAVGLVLEKLIATAVVPGLLLAIALAAYGAITAARAGARRQRFSWETALRTLQAASWELALPVVLLPGIAAGLLRIQDAAALAAIYLVLVAVLVRRDMQLRRDLARIAIASMTTAGVILVVMAMAIGFTGWMRQAEVDSRLFGWLDAVGGSRLAFLLVASVLVLIAGMLVDAITAALVLVPLLAPIADRCHVDPYQFAIVALLGLQLGALSPALGLDVSITSLRTGRGR